MTDPLLLPGSLHTAVTLDDGAELVGRLLTTIDPDELADLIEHAVDKSDRAHAVIYFLLAKARGWDDQASGVEMIAAPTPVSALIVPKAGR